MRFIVDECAGPVLAAWLREGGWETFSVYDDARGSSDDEILAKAAAEDWIIVTTDKDFGEMVYRERRAHRGVILLRLNDERAGNKIAVLDRLLTGHASRLPDQFVVVTETRVRFSRSSPAP